MNPPKLSVDEVKTVMKPVDPGAVAKLQERIDQSIKLEGGPNRIVPLQRRPDDEDDRDSAGEGIQQTIPPAQTAKTAQKLWPALFVGVLTSIVYYILNSIPL